MSLGRSAWIRLAVVQIAQLIPFALLLLSGGEAAWPAGLLGSAICVFGTDSHWRWRNRLLILQAVGWLLVPTLR